MKKTWKIPSLEVLDVSETMKYPKRGGGKKGHGKGKWPKDPNDPVDLFDS